jgi:preprotein translocase subunit SecD
VSIGITADSSILFFERIRDEVGLGKTVRTAVKRGLPRGLPHQPRRQHGHAVRRASSCTSSRSGPVRGFALTLGIATVLDIFILWILSRSAVGLLAGSQG